MKKMTKTKTTNFLLSHPLALHCLGLETGREYTVEDLYPEVEMFINKAADELHQYARNIGTNKFVLGLSGGLDSTFVALVAHRTICRYDDDDDKLILVTLPGFGTGQTTTGNAERIIKNFRAKHINIDIKELCTIAMNNIGLSTDDRSTAFENIQARMRTMLLLTIANKENALELGTGDYSESAVGWCTYGGDNVSSYNINAYLPKSLLRLIVYVKGVYDRRTFLEDVALAPITPELLPSSTEFSQKTEDFIGEYDLIDYLLYEKVVLKNDRKKSIDNAIKYNKIITSLTGRKREEYIRHYADIFYKRLGTQAYKRLSCPSPKLTPLTTW